MKPEEMERLIEAHIAAEKAADTSGAVSMYTEDVEHDVVGTPHGPLHGKEAAQGFYDHLTSNIQTEEMVPTHTYYGEDFCVTEHLWSGRVPGNGKRISFRLLHVWEFRDGLISRENAWLDGGSIVAQLTSDEEVPVT
jgi:ketosteroid isomerase-like protein